MRKTELWVVRRDEVPNPFELESFLQGTDYAPTVLSACPESCPIEGPPLVVFVENAMRADAALLFTEDNTPNRMIPVCYTPGQPGLTNLEDGEPISNAQLTFMIRERSRICRLQWRLRELSGISQSLTTGIDIHELLEQIMDAGIRLTASDAGSMYMIVDAEAHRWASIQHGDPAGNMLQFVYARNHSLPIDLETYFTPIREDSINGHAILTGQPVRIADAYRIPTDAPYRHDRSFDDRTGYRTCSMLTLPLIDRQNEIIGVIQLINKKKEPDEILSAADSAMMENILPYTADDEELMRTFSGQATIAIENTLLYQEQSELLESQRSLNEELTSMNVKLIELSRQILTAHEEERKRIARDIHDGPAQAVANLILKSEICKKLLERGDVTAATTQLDSLQSSIRTASADIRAIIYNLKPSWLEEGLFKAVRSRMDALAEAEGIHPVLVMEGDDGILPQYLTAEVFQIIQESLTNMTKYAEATEVEVRIAITESGLQTLVRDNGKGFDMQDVAERAQKRKATGGFGMEGMKERITLLRGELAVISAPGEGTTVRMSIPI